MTFDPGDVSSTIKRRYTTVSRKELPDDFEEDPLGTLDTINRKYHEAVVRVDAKAAKAYHDWSVRVEIDPEKSLPVTDVTLAQQDTWVVFRGVVARIKKPRPRAVSMAWVCSKCYNVTEVPPGVKPTKCDSCGSPSLVMDVKKSILVDSQDVLLAEHFEEVQGSRPPMLLDCVLDGPLLWSLSPGDRCVVSGVLQLVHNKTGYDYKMHVNNVEEFRHNKRVDPPEIQGDVMDVLVRSFAPHVYGHHTVKESIILLLAGGVDDGDGGENDGRNRHNINMLLVGDPGMAKSELLRETAAAAPLGRYTSGRGSTAAGLTAGMARDRDGVMYLEAGAAVLTDTGVLCMDEFDKMGDKDRAALHEVMEQQAVSIAKLGVIVTMNARVSILAAANPKNGAWDDGLSLPENIDLPETLITRFDLIYNMQDVPDAEADDLISDRILLGARSDALPRESLTAYIEKVRPLKPAMTMDAVKAIKAYYSGARSTAGEIRITPRQLAAVKRLAGARAKIYQRDEITMDDAKRAIYLVENMIQRVLVDPATGQPDYLKATSGKSRSPVRLVEEATRGMEGDFTAVDLVDTVKAPMSDIEQALEKLHSSGIILEGSPGVYRRA